MTVSRRQGGWYIRQQFRTSTYHYGEYEVGSVSHWLHHRAVWLTFQALCTDAECPDCIISMTEPDPDALWPSHLIRTTPSWPRMISIVKPAPPPSGNPSSSSSSSSIQCSESSRTRACPCIRPRGESQIYHADLSIDILAGSCAVAALLPGTEDVKLSADSIIANVLMLGLTLFCATFLRPG